MKKCHLVMICVMAFLIDSISAEDDVDNHITQSDNKNESVSTLSPTSQHYHGGDDISKWHEPYFIYLEDMENHRKTVTFTGTTVTFRCPAKGRPKPEIKWTKDGETITGHHQEGRKWAMKLKNVTENDSGNYTCFVTNAVGQANFTFLLHVKVGRKPVLMEMENVTAYVGETARLHCHVASENHGHDSEEEDPEPYSIEWFELESVNGSYVDSSGAPYAVQLEVDDSGGKDWHHLSIENVTFQDSGRYACRATNRFGSSARSAWLTVVERDNEAVPASSPSLHRAGRLQQVMLSVFSGTISIIVLITGLVVTAYLVKRYTRARRLEKRNKKRALDVLLASSPAPPRPTKSITVNYVTSEFLVPPIVKIESCVMADSTNSRLISTTKADYQFPSDPSWEISRDCITLNAESEDKGRGMLKGIYARTNHDKAMTVSVKKLPNAFKEEDVINLMEELELMKLIGRHEHIISLLGYCCVSHRQLYVIVEDTDGGNLLEFLRRHRISINHNKPDNHQTADEASQSPPITNREMGIFGQQIAMGMSYLESKKFVHRDLAARNVFVSHDHRLKIGNFGRPTTTSFNCKWMAPEVLANQQHSTQSDVWSFGVLLWEIVTGGDEPSYPNHASNENASQLLQIIREGLRLPRPVECHPHLYDVMNDCWLYDTNKRPSFDSLKERLSPAKFET